MSEPLVSVLMACRNSAPFIGDAIDSVLAQTYPNVELVAVDDASEDATPEILARYAKSHPDLVRTALNEGQQGIPAVRTKALEMARGSLICVLDADDIWLPDKVAPQVGVILSRPEVGLVHAAYEAFDSATGKTVPWAGPGASKEGEVLRDLFVDGCFIMTGTVMLRRQALAEGGLGFLDLGFLSYDDYFLYLALSLDWQVAYLDRTVLRYRRHDANLTSRLFAENVHRKRVALLEEFLRRYPEARERLGRSRRVGFARHWIQAAAHERASGRRLRAGGCMVRASLSHPGEAWRSALGFAGRLARGNGGGQHEAETARPRRGHSLR